LERAKGRRRDHLYRKERVDAWLGESVWERESARALERERERERECDERISQSAHAVRQVCRRASRFALAPGSKTTVVPSSWRAPR